MTNDIPQSRFLFAIVLSLSLIGESGCGSGGGNPISVGPGSYPFLPGSSSTWTQQFGASNLYIPPPNEIPPPLQTLTSLVVDSSGNSIGAGYVIGSFNGFQNAPITAYNFIVKFDSTGKLLWISEFGTGSGDFLLGLATDSSGDIYATGISHGALPGYQNSSNQVASVIYKLDANGSLIWQQEFTIDGIYTYSSGVAVDASGYVVVAGIYSVSGYSTSADLFFKKFAGGTGATVWTSSFGTLANNSFASLAADPAGDIYATGTTSGTFPGTSTGPSTTFLLKLNGDTGSQVWEEPLHSQALPYVAPFGLSAADGYVVIGGAASASSIAVGFSADPSAQGFVTKYSTVDGSMIWNNALSSGAGDEITGVSFAPSGDVLATGVTNGIFASGFVQPSDNIVLLQLGPDGTNIAANQFGVGPITNGSAPVGPLIASGASGNVVIAGPVQGAYPGFSNPSNAIQMFIMNFRRP